MSWTLSVYLAGALATIAIAGGLGALRRSEFPPPRLDQSSKSSPSQPVALSRRFPINSIQRLSISCIWFQERELGKSSSSKFGLLLFVKYLLSV
jgi:hypothetical protein